MKELFPEAPSDLPFFPSLLGLAVDKEVVVEKIEAALVLVGLPVMGRNGKRLYTRRFYIGIHVFIADAGCRQEEVGAAR